MEKLRFKDEVGKDYPEWIKNKISEVGFLKTSSIDKLIHPNEEVLSLVNYMDVYKQKKVNNETVKNMPLTSANKNQIENNNLKKGDVLFTPSSETTRDIGHTLSIKEDINNAVYSYHLMRFRPSIEFDPDFLNYVFKPKKSYFQLTQFAQGLTRYTLSIKNLNNLKFDYPTSITEQEKIGNYFSNLDTVINNNQRQLELMEKYKEDLLDKIFNQKVRFKDENGDNYPEWNKVNLSSILTLGNKNKVFDTSQYQKISVKLNLKGLEFFNSKVEMKDTRPFFIRNEGEIIIGKQNFTKGSLAIITKEFDKSICSNAIMSFKSEINQFIYYYLGRKEFLNNAKKNEKGSAQKEISEKDFLSLTIFKPCDLEIKKIENLFSNLDLKINVLKNSIKNLKEFKIDMLEKMF